MTPQEQNTSNDVFAKNLSKAMSDKGWNQGDLTDACGISQGTISNYVRGKREPTASQLSILAAALNVSMERLLHGTGESGVKASAGDGAAIKRARAEAERLARLLGEAEESISRIRSFLG